MPPNILSPELKEQFEALRLLLQRALWLAEKCADAEAAQILRARLANLQSAAMLVIVGEVKAGKSCFINALVQEDVCRVAPEPCTMRIQELVHGAERSVATLGNAWDRVYLPKEVLREVTLVDTPGTNSIIQDHQTITENYIPQSDLVVFVFSAANPHTNSAWEFLTVIRREWHRKMVFVLQQSDRASEQELAANREHVKDYARARGVQNPTVFTLSAKRELEGAAESGFAPFRNFLRYGIEAGEVWRTKVEGSSQTVRTVMGKLLAHLRTERTALTEERAFYQDLLKRVETRQERAASLKVSIVGRLSASYDRIARSSEDEFAGSLRFGEVLRSAIPFVGEKQSDQELRHLRARFHESARGEMAREAPRVAQDLFAEMEGLADDLRVQIAQREARIREGVQLPQAAGGLGSLEELKSKLTNLRLVEMSQLVHETMTETADIKKFTIGGGVLILLGLLTVAFSFSSWLDLVGVSLVAVGTFLLVTGIFWRRSGLLQDFRERLGTSRNDFRVRLEAHLSPIVDEMFNDVRNALRESILRLDMQLSFVEPLLEETFQVGESASETTLRAQQMRLRPPVPQPEAVAV